MVLCTALCVCLCARERELARESRKNGAGRGVVRALGPLARSEGGGTARTQYVCQCLLPTLSHRRVVHKLPHNTRCTTLHTHSHAGRGAHGAGVEPPWLSPISAAESCRGAHRVGIALTIAVRVAQYRKRSIRNDRQLAWARPSSGLEAGAGACACASRSASAPIVDHAMSGRISSFMSLSSPTMRALRTKTSSASSRARFLATGCSMQCAPS